MRANTNNEANNTGRLRDSLIDRCAKAATATVIVLGLLGLGGLVDRAGASTAFTVNTTSDEGLASSSGTTCVGVDGQCSLRAAIQAANNLGGAVTINLPASTYTLSLGVLDVGAKHGASVTIAGEATAVTTTIHQVQPSSCSGSTPTLCNQVISVDPSEAGAVSFALSNVTITGGVAASSSPEPNNGGGISAGGLGDRTTLTGDVLSSDVTLAGGENLPGGAISQEGGNLTVSGCTFSSDSAGTSSGGAIDFESADGHADVLSVTNSTFSGNSSNDPAGGGGAIFVDGFASPGSATVSITGSTFSGNQADGGTSIATGGGAILVESGTLDAFSNNFLNNSTTASGLGGAVNVVGGATSVLAGDRFLGNSIASATTAGRAVAADTSNSASVAASNNWWASNAGPGAYDLTGGVSAATYLQLRISVSVNPVDSGASTVVTADLTHDQNDAAHLTHTIPDGTAVTFGGTAGTYPSGTTGPTASGSASDSMTSGVGGSYTAGATVSVDGVTLSAAVTVDAPPTITTGTATTFTVGLLGTFPVDATGYPTPALSESGALPTGVGFTDNGNGTGDLSGNPAAGTGGVYAVKLTASNGFTPTYTQSFTLTVDEAPKITSANNTAFTIGSAGTFTVSASHSYPGTTLSETGALPGGVTFTGAGVLSGTPAAESAGTYPLTITASNGVNTPATQSFTLTVDGLAPTITWANPAAITYGTKLGSTQLKAKASVPGTFVYSPPVGTVLGAGVQNLSVTFTPKDIHEYAKATDGVTLQVNQATPKVTWAKPASIVYGTALGSTQLDASSTVEGEFNYGTEPGMVLPVGSHSLLVTFTPDDGTDYKTVTAKTTQVVTKATTSTELLGLPSSVQYGRGDLGTLSARVTSSTGPTPTGTVTFKATKTGSTTSVTLCKGAPNSDGTAQCTTSVILAIGTYSVVAIYSGAADFDGSTSPSSPLSVIPVVTIAPQIVGSVRPDMAGPAVRLTTWRV